MKQKQSGWYFFRLRPLYYDILTCVFRIVRLYLSIFSLPAPNGKLSLPPVGSVRFRCRFLSHSRERPRR